MEFYVVLFNFRGTANEAETRESTRPFSRSVIKTSSFWTPWRVKIMRNGENQHEQHQFSFYFGFSLVGGHFLLVSDINASVTGNKLPRVTSLPRPPHQSSTQQKTTAEGQPSESSTSAPPPQSAQPITASTEEAHTSLTPVSPSVSVQRESLLVCLKYFCVIFKQHSKGELSIPADVL